MQFLLEGTVPTGLELTALEEVTEKLNVQGTVDRGRVFFSVASTTEIQQVLKFRSFEHINLVALKTDDVPISNEKDQCETFLRSLVARVSWADVLIAREACRGPLAGSVQTSLDRLASYLVKKKNGEPCNIAADDNDMNSPTFRVTCHRERKNFGLTSMEAAALFGGEVHNCFKWKAKMEQFDIELILRLSPRTTTIGTRLTKSCLSFRNLTERGVACLKGSVCYAILRLCRLNVGDIVCDPLMGSGSLLIEGYTNWPQCQYIGGDINQASPEMCRKNVEFLNRKLAEIGRCPSNVELFHWDATKMPMTTASVDSIVSDLPFGKRMGSQVDNRKLYKNVLAEIARVLRPSTGRAVLLTYDKRSVGNCLVNVTKYLELNQLLTINVGGLFSGVYVIYRTANTFCQ